MVSVGASCDALSTPAAQLIFACMCAVHALLYSHLVEAGPPGRPDLCCLSEMMRRYPATLYYYLGDQALRIS